MPAMIPKKTVKACGNGKNLYVEYSYQIKPNSFIIIKRILASASSVAKRGCVHIFIARYGIP